MACELLYILAEKSSCYGIVTMIPMQCIAHGSIDSPAITADPPD